MIIKEVGLFQVKVVESRPDLPQIWRIFFSLWLQVDDQNSWPLFSSKLCQTIIVVVDLAVAPLSLASPGILGL